MKSKFSNNYAQEYKIFNLVQETMEGNQNFEEAPNNKTFNEANGNISLKLQNQEASKAQVMKLFQSTFISFHQTSDKDSVNLEIFRAEDVKVLYKICFVTGRGFDWSAFI